MVELAVVPATAVGLLQAKDRDRPTLGEVANRLAKAVAHALEEGGGRNRVAKMVGEEADDLARDLEFGNVGVEVDAVQAFEVEDDVALEDVVDVDCGNHDCHSKNEADLASGMAIELTPPAAAYLGGPRLASLILT